MKIASITYTAFFYFFLFSLFVNDSTNLWELLGVFRSAYITNIEFLTIILLDDKLVRKKNLELIVNKYVIIQKADLKT